MDIFSHGLWGAIAFGRKNKKSFWFSFFFGIAPDLFSFGIFTPLSLLGLIENVNWEDGPPPPEMIPKFIHTLYDISHSFVIFALIFLITFLIFRRPIWEMLAWPIHIFLDIFTHGIGFFPTPFLWPIFEYRFDGIPWSHPSIFFTNLVLLGASYIFFFIYRKRKSRRV